MSDDNSSSGRGIIYTLAAIFTAFIGHHIHGSIFFTIMDFLFWPIAWVKWLICQEVNLTIIKDAFSFFLS